MYAGTDSLYKDGMTAISEARQLIAKTEAALKDKGKAAEKADRKQVKADIAALNKNLFKCKPEKMNESDIAALRDAIRKLEESAARL